MMDITSEPNKQCFHVQRNRRHIQEAVGIKWSNIENIKSSSNTKRAIANEVGQLIFIAK